MKLIEDARQKDQPAAVRFVMFLLALPALILAGISNTLFILMAGLFLAVAPGWIVYCLATGVRRFHDDPELYLAYFGLYLSFSICVLFLYQSGRRQ